MRKSQHRRLLAHHENIVFMLLWSEMKVTEQKDFSELDIHHTWLVETTESTGSRARGASGAKLQDESYLMTAVSPWRMVMLSVARCISTLRTGNPVGMRHSSLKKDACNCLQDDLCPTCIVKHEGARALREQIDPRVKRAERKESGPELWLIIGPKRSWGRTDA